ncbi:FtsX-like permease family protein [Nocardioides sp. NPDC004968]|uniref:FtsX-like permease family protein n=1 Tax=Nocardioides sp. NPDC004968 TaxID=3155894 RepID=UPI0033BDA53A
MLSALRFRAGQVVVIALLSALVTACAAFAPLYDRAMQQAAVSVILEDAPSAVRDLQIYGPDAGWSLRTAPDDLLGLIPGADHLFQKPVRGNSATTELDLGRFDTIEGDLWWRAGQCEHVVVTVGSCPSASRQIMVSENEAHAYGFAVGTTVNAEASSLVATPGNPDPPIVQYEIVGVYRAADPDWWQGLQLEGLAGVADGDLARHDVWLTDESTFATPTPILSRERPWVGYRLRTQTIGVHELETIATDIARLRTMLEDQAGAATDSTARDDPSPSAVTSLPALAEQVDAQIEQGRTTVPLLLCQLGLLGLLVLWLMLRAATDQRRFEVVVARLRGRGTAGARTLLMRELVPAALLGVVPGAAVALIGSWLARTYILPGDPPFELPRGLLVAILIAVAVLVLVTYAAVIRVAREPLGTLLHRTAGHRPGWLPGVGDAIAIAVSGVGVVAFATSSLTGALALAAPALLSVFVGLVLAHILPPAAARLGGSLLQQGRLRAGVSLLDASRSIMTRRTVALATVAGALAVFSVCGLVVGDRNRGLAAEQAVGAPAVVELQSTSLTATRLTEVESVLADLDPDGTRVTPVVRTAAPSGGIATLAVEPEAFSRIALFAEGAPSQKAWAALSAGPARTPIPTIAAGEPAEVEADKVKVHGVDGILQEARRVAVVDRIPGDGPDLTVVDLATAKKLAEPDSESSISIWFASEDPAFIDKVTDALASKGVFAADTRTLTGVRHNLDASMASWSLWLGGVVGIAAVLLAVVALTVLTVTSWRVRAMDLTALRLAGVGQRTVARIPTDAQLLSVLVGVVAGAACGAIGAALTLPDIPLFAIPPEVDVTDLSIPWLAVATTTIGCLIVLCATAVVLGRSVAATVRFDRLRETA